MVFSSAIFLFLFLPVVLLGYFLMPRSMRNLFLLIASLFFYAWGEGFYVALMLTSVALNYIAGRLIDRFRDEHAGKIILAVTVAINLLLLGGFKYANFLVENLNMLLAAIEIPLIDLDPVHLPIGISFFTFQAMSYVIDVYRRDAEVQHNPINSALYIALFPQLIAGPIVRYHDVAKQLVSRTVTLEFFASGVGLFIVGLGKKMLIANPMGEIADKVFAIPAGELTADIAWLGVSCYTLQIYFDFSGYSDMAIGLGRMFGFNFLINFNYPYIAQSMREFWRRWHISLSRWFRDYLYVPLGGNRLGPTRTYINLLIVFVLCGFWHGASWNFLIWGLLHGAFLALERTRFGDFLKKLWRPLRHAYVLLAVMISWVFFRADDLPYALRFLAAMFGMGHGSGLNFHLSLYIDNLILLILMFGCIGSIPILPALRDRLQLVAAMYPVTRALVSVLAVTVLLAIVVGAAMHLAAGTHNPFIYFRF